MPVLWQDRSANYSNRTKRDEAWDSLVQLIREKIPEADLCFVKKKVKLIRAFLRKELGRVGNSKRSRLSADDVYKLKQLYSDLLLFMADQDIPRKSKSNLEGGTEDVDRDSQETTALTTIEVS
jgi:hypothetical protein